MILVTSSLFKAVTQNVKHSNRWWNKLNYSRSYTRGKFIYSDTSWCTATVHTSCIYTYTYVQRYKTVKETAHCIFLLAPTSNLLSKRWWCYTVQWCRFLSCKLTLHMTNINSYILRSMFVKYNARYIEEEKKTTWRHTSVLRCSIEDVTDILTLPWPTTITVRLASNYFCRMVRTTELFTPMKLTSTWKNSSCSKRSAVVESFVLLLPILHLRYIFKD